MIARKPTILQSLTRTAVALVCMAAASAMAQEPSKAAPAKPAQPAAKAALSFAPDRERPMVEVYSLRYAEAGEILRLLPEMVPDVRMAVDRRTNAVVAYGPARALKEVKSLIEKFDVRAAEGKKHAAVTFTVRVVWLAEGLSDKLPGSFPPSRDLLAGVVVPELDSLGIGTVRQVAQTVLKTGPDGQFQVSASPLLEGTPVDFTASGKVLAVDQYMAQKSAAAGKTLHVEKDGANLKIKISAARQRAERPAGPGSDMRQKLTDIELETVVGLGDYTVLAVAPTEAITSIFVIQVTPNLSLIRP